MTALLSFQELAVSRGDRLLQRGLAGAVAAGELLHVRGPNGAGKTSLLEVLAGLRLPESGSVDRPAPLHWIGHRNGFAAPLTPHENLVFWCQLQGLGSSTVRGALREFNLETVSDRPYATLSAGQRRRTALARLVLERRPLWLLDEPLAALDVAGIERWTALLADHLRAGGAAILTSHQPVGVAATRVLELA